MSSAEEDRKRAARAERVALFRYQLIREAADPALTVRQRGRLVRELAARAHEGPFGEPVVVSRATIDRWIRAWKAGGFASLAPPARQVMLRTDAAVLALAAALKRENPERTAAQVRRILRTTCRVVRRRSGRCSGTSSGWSWPRGRDGRAPLSSAGSRREAPNEMWTGDVLHGPLIGGKKTYLVAFLDDHSRFVTGARWGWSEDSLHLAAAFKRAVAARGLPARAYVDNGACFRR